MSFWFFILIWLTFGIISALVGNTKKIGAAGGFVYGILLGFIGFIIVLVNPNKEDKSTSTKSIRTSTF